MQAADIQNLLDVPNQHVFVHLDTLPEPKRIVAVQQLQSRLHPYVKLHCSGEWLQLNGSEIKIFAAPAI